MPEIPQCDSSQTESRNKMLKEEQHLLPVGSTKDEHNTEDASANAAGFLDASLITEKTQLPESSLSGETKEHRELKKGDWVKVKDLTEEEFTRLQDGHGGFVSVMLQVRTIDIVRFI